MQLHATSPESSGRATFPPDSATSRLRFCLGSGQQLAVQNGLRFDAPLRVPNGDPLDDKPLIGIGGNGVDQIALGITKMLNLGNDLASVISCNHFYLPDPVERENSRAMLSTSTSEGATIGRKTSIWLKARAKPRAPMRSRSTATTVGAWDMLALQ